MSKNKIIARAYIMGKYGMLQCAANYSNGYGSKDCRKCLVVDDESHRINHCKEWSNINLANSDTCIDYDLINSDNVEDSMKVVEQIMAMWDLGNNKNCMKTMNV